MKTTISLFTVFTLLFTAVQTASAVESVALTSITPALGSYRLHSEYVNYTFEYTTANASGVRVFGIPYTKGSSSPNLAINGSPIYPTGTGSGSGFFRITSGDRKPDPRWRRAEQNP